MGNGEKTKESGNECSHSAGRSLSKKLPIVREAELKRGEQITVRNLYQLGVHPEFNIMRRVDNQSFLMTGGEPPISNHDRNKYFSEDERIRNGQQFSKLELENWKARLLYCRNKKAPQVNVQNELILIPALISKWRT